MTNIIRLMNFQDVEKLFQIYGVMKMTYKEAEEIISLYEDYEDRSCTCFQGHAPCGKCVQQPSEEDYEKALKIFDQYNEK